MSDDSSLLRLGEGLMAILLGVTGGVIVASWILGRARHSRGANEQAPAAGSVSADQHHASIPGR
ncbi:MAG: hypothetical protein ACR2PL_14295 [Dehalococcoidia bacterium]